MKINSLIDRDVTSVSVLEEIYEVGEWLKVQHYMAVVDEDMKTIGIITRKDILLNPSHGEVIDCDIKKPKASPDHTIDEVYKLMASSETDFLPVYEHNQFVGVISLKSLTEHLLSVMTQTQQSFQRAIQDIRNPVNNLTGLCTVLHHSVLEPENEAITELCMLFCKSATDILDNFDQSTNGYAN